MRTLKNNITGTYGVVLLLFIMLFLSFFCVACNVNANKNTEDDSQTEIDSNHPIENTYEESSSMDGEQQMSTQNNTDSMEVTDISVEEEPPKKTIYPWNKEGAKQPSEYTWEEFDALSGEEQMVFQNSFESIDAFDAWLQKAQSKGKKYPWNKEGAKQPSEYTWEEFEALSGEEQIVFQNSFESFDDFDKWLIANQPK